MISGTDLGEVDGQLAARPAGPGRLHLCTDRGSEVFEVDGAGARPIWCRTATADEEAALDRAADATVAVLSAKGLVCRVVSKGLNRRKVDLIPEQTWAGRPRSRTDALLVAVTKRLHAAGIADHAEVVALAADAAMDAGLVHPRVTSDGKHVEIGLTDTSDSVRWAAAWLADRGITGSLVLVAGAEFGPVGGAPGRDSMMMILELARSRVVSVGVEAAGVPAGVEHVGGGPDQLASLLHAQVTRRSQLRVPDIDDDPAWVLTLPEDEALVRVAEALGTLGNGWAALRASREEGGPETSPLFVANGVYTGSGPIQHLLEGPEWTQLMVPTGRPDRRLLDLRTGMLTRTSSRPTGLKSIRFLSVVRPWAIALRAEHEAADLGAGTAIADPDGGEKLDHGRPASVVIGRTGQDGAGGIVVATRDRDHVSGDVHVVERLGAWGADPRNPPVAATAIEQQAQVESIGFDQLAAEHRAAWARRWADATVTIDGDEQSQLAARFALFHLLAAAPDAGDAAVGARGMTGPAYGGHVFWDADVFVLPVLAAVQPAAARAMLEYRIRRLPAARAAAAGEGEAGARFPWESARDGTDVTPVSGTDARGREIEIRTGALEQHIVADVAWAASEYEAWTGDTEFLAGPGGELVAETARYWSSRIEVDSDGHGHLRGVIGPDEYHELVDDNAFTNVMARWNLRRAAQLAEHRGGAPDEVAHWRRMAERLVDGWDPGRGAYEQFAGYWDLEPLLVAKFADPPVAADVLLGADRVKGSQIIKQADVVMLHHLVPDELEPGSLAGDLAFYGPRTAHGSSLSPAIHAAVLARAGQPDRALELFRMAAELDFHDLTGTTAGGVHLATLGGLWQALAYGFLGLRPRAGVIRIDPHLPSAWHALTLSFRFGGYPVTVRADQDSVTVRCDEAMMVQIGGDAPVTCQPPEGNFSLGRSEP
ncbi:MAG: glycosyl hydrolase family 65 protein [Candidatus Nanopelagicales bacterium]